MNDISDRLIINIVDGSYMLLNAQGVTVHTLQVGEIFELFLFNAWQVVRFESGGYKGRYYVTAEGVRGRLAVCMQARLCQVPVLGTSPAGTVPNTLEGTTQGEHHEGHFLHILSPVPQKRTLPSGRLQRRHRKDAGALAVQRV